MSLVVRRMAPSSKESVYDLLAYIQKHRGLHVPEWSLSRVDAFLYGYRTATEAAGFTLRGFESFQTFDEWVAHRLGFPEKTHGWCWMILKHATNEEQAFLKFYELLSEFRKELRV